ncbi:hypothetical protein V513_09275 [Mesotoga sp. H07.pep.5.3]|nr:hypothetical protein V513_09275 [Mesotoga sp. H07.pep.5.3]
MKDLNDKDTTSQKSSPDREDKPRTTWTLSNEEPFFPKDGFLLLEGPRSGFLMTVCDVFVIA